MPKSNITLTDTKPVIGDNCEFCLGCVHHCKNHTINTNKEKKPNTLHKLTYPPS